MEETAIDHSGNTGHPVTITVEWKKYGHDIEWRCTVCAACGEESVTY